MFESPRAHQPFSLAVNWAELRSAPQHLRVDLGWLRRRKIRRELAKSLRSGCQERHFVRCVHRNSLARLILPVRGHKESVLQIDGRPAVFVPRSLGTNPVVFPTRTQATDG